MDRSSPDLPQLGKPPGDRRIHFTHRGYFLSDRDGAASGILHILADPGMWLDLTVSDLPGALFRIYDTAPLPVSEIDQVLAHLSQFAVETLVIWGGSCDLGKLICEIVASFSSRSLHIVFVYCDRREAHVGERVRHELLDPWRHRAAFALRHRPNTTFARLGGEGPPWFEDLPELLLPLPSPQLEAAATFGDKPILFCDLPKDDTWGGAQYELFPQVFGDRTLLISKSIPEQDRLPDADVVDILALEATQPLMSISDLVVDLGDGPGSGLAARTALALGRPFLTTWRAPKSLAAREDIAAMFVPPWFEVDELTTNLQRLHTVLTGLNWSKRLIHARDAYQDLAETRWNEILRQGYHR
jgi:hypothetical protein